jgi:REP-associated tyrosine transposase
MKTPVGHRKLIKHDDAPGEAHALTFSCFGRRQLLRLDSRCQLLAEAIDRAMARHRYQLLAYVFMPEHVHLLVWPSATASKISQLLYAIKKPFSYRVKQSMIAESDPLLDVLTIRERPGETCFRFWQEGPGFDRNIRDSELIWRTIEYIHRNPTRRSLVSQSSDWKWSSWWAYSEEKGDVPMRPRVSVWS